MGKRPQLVSGKYTLEISSELKLFNKIIVVTCMYGTPSTQEKLGGRHSEA